MNRLEKLKKQHPELDISLIDIISSCEPTSSYKYMDFLIKVLKDEYMKGGDYDSFYRKITLKLYDPENLIQLIEFEKHIRDKRIEKTDIGSYRNFKDVIDAVDKADYQVKLKQVEKEVIKLYETQFWLVLIPLSFQSSKVYGSGTKWCTTQLENWERYKHKYKLIYIIDKKTDNKWAISIEKQNKEVLGWLSNDNKTNAYELPFSNEIYSVIIPEIKKFDSIMDIVNSRTISKTVF